jgi:hypothetical protein
MSEKEARSEMKEVERSKREMTILLQSIFEDLRTQTRTRTEFSEMSNDPNSPAQVALRMYAHINASIDLGVKPSSTGN